MGKVLVAAFDCIDIDEEMFSDLTDFLKSKYHMKMMGNYANDNHLERGDLLIDSKSRSVKIKGEPVRLTTTEFEILYLLASHPGWVFTYQQIYESIWNEEYACEKGSIMSHIQRLRRKIEADCQHPQYIENIRGIGYRFNG